MSTLSAFAAVTALYVLAHGLTALLITPLQMRVLPDVTAFASLVYLPHGVRILSTWLMGRIAFFPLFIGAFLSEILFTGSSLRDMMDPVMLASLVVGAASAMVAFELLKLFGNNFYAGQSQRIHWTRLLIVGVIASVINSIGQSVVFSSDILTGHAIAVLVTYAVGDLIGLVVTTLNLMLVFRWLRLAEG